MARAKIGSKGTGEFYRIVVRDKNDFQMFRNQDVGDPGHIERIAGKRNNGRWATQTWLVSKEDAKKEGNKLVPVTDDAKKLFDMLGSELEWQRGDIFKAKDRPNVPEDSKPTPEQKRAWNKNLIKARNTGSP